MSAEPITRTDTVAWNSENGTYDAVLYGRRCRIVLYPEDSPLAGKYGCYLDGRYKGVAKSLDNAKSRCRSLSGLSSTARDRINLKTWQSN